MKKLLNNPWVAGTLALFAIVFVASSLRDGGNGGSQAALGGIEPDEFLDEEFSEQADAGELTPAAIRKIVLGLSIPESLPDPFATVQSKALSEAGPAPGETATLHFHLSGLWTQNGETLVLINDRILRAGDTLGRVSIESADSEGAWLTHADGREFLTVGSGFDLVISPTPSESSPSTVALHEN